MCIQILLNMKCDFSVKFFSSILYVGVFCLFVCASHACLVSEEARTKFREVCEAPQRCQKSKPGPLEEKTLFLTSEPSLQALLKGKFLHVKFSSYMYLLYSLSTTKTCSLGLEVKKGSWEEEIKELSISITTTSLLCPSVETPI